ncbi:hypothetical protein KIPB_009270, partial [Kipferlia bialata]
LDAGWTALELIRNSILKTPGAPSRGIRRIMSACHCLLGDISLQVDGTNTLDEYRQALAYSYAADGPLNAGAALLQLRLAEAHQNMESDVDVVVEAFDAVLDAIQDRARPFVLHEGGFLSTLGNIASRLVRSPFYLGTLSAYSYLLSQEEDLRETAEEILTKPEPGVIKGQVQDAMGLGSRPAPEAEE